MTEAKKISARDNWTSADAYQRFMGRWSPRLAESFVPWLNIQPSAAWLDVGCGTGALSRTILALAAPSRLLGVDPSEAFVDFARKNVNDARTESGSGEDRSRVAKQTPSPQIEFKVGNAAHIPAEDKSFDVAVSGLVLNFVPDPDAAIEEIKRVVKPGGMIGAYVWDYSDGMRMLRIFFDAAIALDPAAVEADEGRRFPLCHPRALAKLFDTAELHRVETFTLEFNMEFKDFDDYWQPFTGVQGPAPGYLAKLPPEKQKALREEVRGRLPANADGSISLAARAWAVKGNK